MQMSLPIVHIQLYQEDKVLHLAQTDEDNRAANTKSKCILKRSEVQ